MVGTVHTIDMMIHVSYPQFVANGIIAGDDLFPAGKKRRISVELSESDSCHDICHVAFIPWAYDIILP